MWTRYKCELCGKENMTSTKMKKHLEDFHHMDYTEYFWKYYYKFEGEPVCPTCHKKLKWDRLDRPQRFCDLDCWYKSKEMSILSSTTLKKQWEDSEFRRQQLEHNSERLKKLWESEEFRKKKSLELSEAHKDPKFMYRKLQSRGVDVTKPSYLYLIRYKDIIKVGITFDFHNRVERKNPDEIINVIKFNRPYMGLVAESRIHKRYSEFSLSDGTQDSTEIYPITKLDDISNYFSRLKQRMELLGIE